MSSRTAAKLRRGIRGAFSLVPFSCASKRKEPARRKRGKLKERAHKESKSWIDSPREYSLGKLTAQSACAGITD